MLGQLSSRRAEIQGMDMRQGNSQAIRALLPLAELFGYATELRSATQAAGYSRWNLIIKPQYLRLWQSRSSIDKTYQE